MKKQALEAAGNLDWKSTAYFKGEPGLYWMWKEGTEAVSWNWQQSGASYKWIREYADYFAPVIKPKPPFATLTENADAITTDAIGMPKKDAEGWFADKGYTMRVTKKDGNHTIVTRDFRTDRINVELEDGLVSAIKSIG
jgi:hypothetical protein